MISKDSRKVVGEYVFLSKYSQTHNGVKETWDEAVNRVMTMHWNRYKEIVNEADMPEFERLFGFAEKLYHQQIFLQTLLSFSHCRNVPERCHNLRQCFHKIL
jgi:hypothetical protein